LRVYQRDYGKFTDGNRSYCVVFEVLKAQRDLSNESRFTLHLWLTTHCMPRQSPSSIRAAGISAVKALHLA